MVNPLNGSGSQQSIANPFQQRHPNNDDKQTGDAAKTAKPAQVSQQQRGQHVEQSRPQHVAHSSNESKPQNAGRGRLVDITV